MIPVCCSNDGVVAACGDVSDVGVTGQCHHAAIGEVCHQRVFQLVADVRIAAETDDIDSFPLCEVGADDFGPGHASWKSKTGEKKRC